METLARLARSDHWTPGSLWPEFSDKPTGGTVAAASGPPQAEKTSGMLKNLPQIDVALGKL
jgi:hypothetical protein